MSSRDNDFARVYEEHLGYVYGFLYYRLRDLDLAEDLAHATFERALRAWPRFDPRRASERTWLLTIARNLMIDHHRREQPEPTERIDERLLPTVDGPEQGTDAWPQLHEALQKLTDREQELIALRFGADLRGSEIADLTDLSLANVQQILSRALKRLRTLLEDSEAVRA